MLTYERIAEEARAYANLTNEQLDGMGTDTLHEQLSLRLVAQEEVTFSKKSFTGSANDLLKRIKSDIICINREIRRRHSAADEAEDVDSGIIPDALALPGGILTINQ